MGRQLKGAEFQTARNPEGRRIPDCATDEGRDTAHRSPAPSGSCAVGLLRPLAFPRSLEFRALWDSAPFGIWRRLEFRAVQQSKTPNDARLGGLYSCFVWLTNHEHAHIELTS
jgi:hypothetical protein